MCGLETGDSTYAKGFADAVGAGYWVLGAGCWVLGRKRFKFNVSDVESSKRTMN
jgi:hypothetical protein